MNNRREDSRKPVGLTRRQLVAGLGAAAVLSSAAPLCALAEEGVAHAGMKTIELAGADVLVDGQPASEDPSMPVFVSNDVVYYEDRDAYESGNPYGEGTAAERHTAEEAAGVTVVNISAPGTYHLSGKSEACQVCVRLGEEAAEDPTAQVFLVLDGVDIENPVAPAIVFYNVYECDGGWSTETAGPVVDTSEAGANLCIADGTVNNVVGSHVARIYKDKEGQKKLWKQDGCVYSYMSMNVLGGPEGTGVLNIVADNEGLDSELHLTIEGGNINIVSDNDGINTNEDGVSVTTVNGGTLHILAGLGAEGDGVDSNGWLVINGGTVISAANPGADSGLDSDMGSYVNGGTVVAFGSTMDWAESDSDQVTMNLQFAASQSAGDAVVVTDGEGKVVFAYDPSEDETAGTRIRTYTGAVISCPAFQVGDTYNVYVGGQVMGQEVQGVYDTATVTDYQGGVQQGFTGTDVRMGPGGFSGRGGMPGGERPEGMPGGFDGERPKMPQGDFQPGDMLEGEHPEPPQGDFQPGGEAPEPLEGVGGKRPEMPQGDFQHGDMPAGERPELPEGGFQPGGEPGQMPQGDQTLAEPAGEFYMQDKVNCFSGVQAL